MNEKLFALAFPLSFLSMWLAVTTLLGGLSGWFELQRRYSRGVERPILTLHMRSGTMGVGVQLNGILTLSACPSGLSVGVWRIFGIFQRPFFVPWQDIRSESVTRFFQPMSKLSFGFPETGRLTIDRRSWVRLSSVAGGQLQANMQGGSVPHVLERDIVQGMIVQWAVITAGATAFFYLTSRLGYGSPHVPLAVCFGFPAIVFGFSQLYQPALISTHGPSL